MKSLIIVILSLISLLISGCNHKLLNYPYAENNKSIESYYNTLIEDDYKWLEYNISENKLRTEWLINEQNLSLSYFKNKDKNVYEKVNILASQERHVLIRSMNDTVYYAGIMPYSNKVNIYSYDNNKNISKLVTTIKTPFQPVWDINALVLKDGKHITIVGGTKGDKYNLYIYDLDSNNENATETIYDIYDKPLVYSNDGFFISKENLSESSSAIRSLYYCSYSKKNKLNVEIVYSDNQINLNSTFDYTINDKRNTLYIGKYNDTNMSDFEIISIDLSTLISQKLCTIKSSSEVEKRLTGVDDQNIYFIDSYKDFKGSLYSFNRLTHLTDTLFINSTMPIKQFAMIKDYTLIYLQGHSRNKAYLIHKESKKIDELPIKDNFFYKFHYKKCLDSIFFQRESLTSPSRIYCIKSDNKLNPKLIYKKDTASFNQDAYTTEYLTIKNRYGRDINLLLTYKKGIKRDGSNPLFLCSYLNSENSFLDKYYLPRTLYMDNGYIFVQRSKSDSKKNINFEEKIDDLYTTINHLIKEKYTSENKIALFGKEYGATAIMQLLNKYDIEAPTVLIDGIYDLVKYNEGGKLLYNNKRLYQVSCQKTFNKLLNNSPYHNVKYKKSYPPILLMSSNENLFINKYQTYKMTAKLQMRTKGFHPILMLTPEYVNNTDEYSEYSYKMYIDHAFWFLSKSLNL